jgi:hypothetical protein
MTNTHEIRLRETGTMTRLGRTGLVAIGILLLGACDTDVINPGNVDDKSLNDRGAQPALVRGAGRAIGQGLNWLSYTGAAVTREIHPAGSTGSFGITPDWQNGILILTDEDLDDHWELSQRGRWVAEETVRRIDAAGPLNANTHQQALLFAGFSNRILGDNMCEAVFDGGPAEPNAKYWERAEAFFTQAIAIQSGAMQTAAYGGRAQARVFLGKWNEALADAANVPTVFVFNQPYYNVGEDTQRNRIFYSSGNTRESGSAYRAHTQWNTWHHAYREATGDPRVPIQFTNEVGDAAIQCCGKVPFWPQNKHPSSAAPIRLVSGREMRLIEAEAKLRNNDVVGAMTSINAVRTAAGAPLVVAADATEAWRLLKRERGIELWLEGRRIADLRRWKDGNTPGALDPLEVPGSASHLTQQDLCFPISKSERDTNPNF